jgi:NAD(P) transhydrogenase subunit alpha
MRIGVPRETHPGERRVATTPEVAGQLQKLGYQVIVEKDAGAAASFSDEAYEEAGCTIADSAADIWDIILKVRPPEGDQAKGLKDSQTLVSFLYPGQNPDLLEQLTGSGGTALAMDSVPRI